MPSIIGNDADTQRYLFDRLRSLPPWRKDEMLSASTRSAYSLAMTGLRKRYPSATEAELRKRFAAMRRRAFLASCLYLAGLIACAAVGIHPYVLPAIGDAAHGLTAAAAAAPDYGLKVGLAWWLPGMMLVAGYFVYVYRSFAGKVRLDEDGY